MKPNMLNPKARQVQPEAPEVTPSIEVEEAEDEAGDAYDNLVEVFGTEVPSRQMIEGWKAVHSAVFTYVPSQDEFFMFRPLKRQEHRNAQKEMSQIAERGVTDSQGLADIWTEKVVGMCVLFPNDLMTPTKLNNSPAGLMTALFSLIMEKSHFVTAEAALQSCVRL